MFLNDSLIRNAKPQAKPRKLSDGDGLYLLVQPNGSRWWRMKCCFGGREKTLSAGVYPEISLKQARLRREEIRQQVAAGIGPGIERKGQEEVACYDLEVVAREWWEKRKKLWSAEYGNAIIIRFEKDVFPFIGGKPIKSLIAADFLECLERVEKRGVLETAHKVKAKCSEVMRYAVATRRAERDSVVDFKGALTPVKHRYHASITYPSEVGALLRAIDGYRRKLQVVYHALRLLPLVFVRSSELRYAVWQEFELGAATWRIPAERMKMPNPHIVPLLTQAVAILRVLHVLTGPVGAPVSGRTVVCQADQ